VCVFACMYVCIYTRKWRRVRVFNLTYTHICMYVCVSYIHICMCVFACMYVYTHESGDVCAYSISYALAEGSQGTHLIYALAVEGHVDAEGAQAVVVGRRHVAFSEMDATASEWSLLRFARQFDKLEEDATFKVLAFICLCIQIYTLVCCCMRFIR
jgi:hypothetical protein